MSGRYDVPATLGKAQEVERPDSETVVIEATIGGVSQQVTVRRSWWVDNLPGGSDE